MIDGKVMPKYNSFKYLGKKLQNKSNKPFLKKIILGFERAQKLFMRKGALLLF
jgi:hypothetical protein